MTRQSRSGLRSGLLVSGVLGALTVGSAVVTLPAASAAPSTDASAPVGHDRVVSSVPASFTPQVKDGRVLSIVQVGTSMVAAGPFTQVSAANGSGQVGRQGVFAFNATTGAITAGFNPSVNGAIDVVFPGPAGTVYIAGTFSTVNGQSASKVALLNVSNGALVTDFKAPTINGAVKDMVKLGDRLYIAGAFTTVGGVVHKGLAALNASTGARDTSMGVDVSVNHNWTPGSDGARAAVGVTALAVTPDGRRLVAIGNFKQADGLVRDQVVLVDISGTTAQVVPNWRTRRYEDPCFSGAFDTYVRDVDFAPDGSYFVIVATGGPNPGTLCDTVARWATSATGDAVQPVWLDDTGGDTLFSVAATGAAVYTGGHQRWQNNAGGLDSTAPGAVPRPGIGAVDPRSGVVTSWNPGRNPRGVGAFALQPTAAGLWVGSDTNHIGNRQYLRPRLAFFPLAGGEVPAASRTTPLPANVYLGSPGVLGAKTLVRRFFDGTTAGATSAVDAGGLDWSTVRAATMIDGELWYGRTDGTFHRRTFNGTTYGPDRLVDPYNDPKWSSVSTGSGQTYQGRQPRFYSELGSITGLAFRNGELYSTKGGVLSAQGFTPDSGVMSGAPRTVASIPGIGGIFFSGDFLYYSHTTTGVLWRVAFANGAPSGSPTVVSTADWRAGTLFTGP